MSVSIGELVGTVSLEDRFSHALDLVGLKTKDVFGKMDGWMGATVVATGAVATALTAAAGTIVYLGTKGSHINDVERSFERLAGGMDNATSIMTAMNKGVADTVDSMDLLQFANKALSTGAIKSAQDFGTVTAAARLLSREGFGPVESQLSSIQQALTTGRVRALQYQIGIIDLKTAEDKYAKSIGTTRDQLSAQGRLHADQIAIYERLNKKLAEAGEQQKSFAEKIKSGSLAIGNWFDDIAKGVAKSTEVNRAIDSIGQALIDNFGGGAKTLQEAIIRWINRFADAAATYGPIVIKWLRSIYDGVLAIWKTVQEAWSTVPDWFKNIAKDAGTAGIAVYGLQKVVLGLTSDAVVGQVASFATIWSGFGAAIIKVTGTIVGLAKGAVIYVQLAYAFGGLTEVVLSLGTALGTVGAAIAASPLFIPALFVALGAAIWEVAKAIQAMIDHWNSGKSMWEFFSAKDDDTFIRRWLGLSSGINGTAAAMKALGEQRAGLDALMKIHSVPGARFMMTSRQGTQGAAPPPPSEIQDRTKEVLEATKASIVKTSQLWNEYFTTFDKHMGESLDAQMRGIDRWYEGEKATLDKSKKDNANYWSELTALTTLFWEKKAVASQDFYMEKARRDMESFVSFMEESFNSVIPLAIRDTTNGIVTMTDSTAMAEKRLAEALNANRPGVMTDAVRKLVKELDKAGVSSEEIARIFGLLPKQVEDAVNGCFGPLHRLLDGWADTMTQLAQVSGDSFGGAIKEIAEIIVSWDAAAKAADAYTAATTKAGKAIALVQGATAIAAATGSGSRAKRTAGGALTGMEMGMAIAGPWGAVVGAGVGALVGWVRGANAAEKQMNKTRQAFVDGAGGLDLLNQHAHAAGTTLDAVLSAKTPEEYKAALDALNMSFETLAATQAAGFNSSDDLQKMADTADRVYKFMLASGKYTAEELAKAFQNSAEAQARALRDPAQAMADAASAAGYQTQEELQKAADDAQKLAEYMRDSGKYTAQAVEDAFKKAHEAQDRAFGQNTEALDKLKSQYEALSESIKGEAPEEVMGSIEAATRGQMAALEAQIKAAQDAQTAGGEDTANKVGDAMAGAADGMKNDLIEAGELAANNIAGRFAGMRLKIPVEFILPNGLPAGAGGGTGGSGTGAAFAGASYTFGANSFGAASGNDIVIAVDGREIARAAVPHIPSELRRRGQ